MTDSDQADEIPVVFPQPRKITLIEGDCVLSEDVRLVTKNVVPLFRKNMRTILGSAGIRVVANKKRFIVDVQILTPEDLDTDGVPEEALAEFYELVVEGNTARVRTVDQPGALWGVQTLSDILRQGLARGRLQAVKVRDWPTLGNRGIFIENKWGPDRMVRDDWFKTIDRLSRLKMNRVGIGLYGCWCCQYEGKVTEFLMVPVPDHEELRTEKTLKWFSPALGKWTDETYVPPLVEHDLLAEVVAHGHEKGVEVIPFVNSLGHNTLFPRLMPNIAAKAEDGSPVGTGYCLSNPKTREFIDAFYGSIVERYYPDGAPFFHIQMDEVYPVRADVSDPGRPLDPWCHCPECRAREREDLLREYILWLVDMLTKKGVDKVVIWNDQLTRHMDVLGDAFVKQLREAGLADRLIVHWWWYSNTELNERVDPAIGKRLGLAGWVAPMTCYYNWSRYSTRLANIKLMSEAAIAGGAEGSVAYSVHDAAWADHEAVLAEYAWNVEGFDSVDDIVAHWAEASFGDMAAAVLEAKKALEKAALDPVLQPCWYYGYTYYRDGKPYPRHYPEEPLDALAGRDSGDAAVELAAVTKLAFKAQAAFEELLAVDDPPRTDEKCLKSLLGEAARTAGVAAVFQELLALRAEICGGTIPADAAKRCEDARDTLVEAMAVCEDNKPDWVVPAVLRDLSVLLEFLDQLAEDLDKGDPAAVRWFVDNPLEQHGSPEGEIPPQTDSVG